VSAEDVIVEDRFLGPGYGQPSHELREAVRRAAACEGLLLDPVYSGRAAAGLLHLGQTGRLGSGATIFMHTGGAPALFAYPEMVADDPLPAVAEPARAVADPVPVTIPAASFRSGVR
jgi:1-aminocyclopropane-1-carboxylate deaminase/D-cysteine desulfhydrase-like pyridoxal-dependent ACC family enzyme